MGIKWRTEADVEVLRVCDLVEDRKLYPRIETNWEHVQRIVDAMEAGVVFPPIVTDRATKRIIDGLHRKAAVEIILGANGKIPCVEREYASDQERLLDAVRCNSGHGLSLSAGDRGRILGLAQELKIEPTQLAGALRMTVEATARLSTRKPINSAKGVVKPAGFVVPKFKRRPDDENPDNVFDSGEAPKGMAAVRKRAQILQLVIRVYAVITGDYLPTDPAVLQKLRELKEALDAMNLENVEVTVERRAMKAAG